MQIGREEVKLSLFADDMILYIENPKVSTQKLLELTNELKKFQDTRLIYRNLLLFYALIMNYHKVLKLPFKITSKRIKYLGINLTKEVKDLYTENYKTLIKEMIQRNGKLS